MARTSIPDSATSQFFINVKNNVDGSIFNGITVIEVNNESNKIERVVESKSAIFDGQNINMDSTNIFSINSTNLFVISW